MLTRPLPKLSGQVLEDKPSGSGGLRRVEAPGAFAPPRHRDSLSASTARPSRLELDRGFADELPYPDGSFDRVLSC